MVPLLGVYGDRWADGDRRAGRGPVGLAGLRGTLISQDRS